MTTRSNHINHILSGGWATDFGGIARVGVSKSGDVEIPWLDDVGDLLYTLAGGFGKPGGTEKINATAFESGATIKGIFDYWILGSSGTQQQHRIVHVGTKVKKDDGDASFTDLKTGLESGKMPSYAVLEDLLVWASDSTVDVPQSWDGTTQQNLAGSPPNFSFVIEHQGRLWASGDASDPSKVYYTSRFDPTNWNGAGSGEFNISPSDGDKVTGLASYKDRLWIFKGPNKGSIQYISGTAPTGNDGYRRDTFKKSIGAVNHQTVFSFGDDLGFMAPDGHIHSIKNLQDKELYNTAALTFPIGKWIETNIKFSDLSQAVAAHLEGKGLVLLGVPLRGGSTNNMILGLDFRFQSPRLFKWPTFKNMASAITQMINPDDANRKTLVLGGTDGFIRTAMSTTKTLDTGGNMNQYTVTPYLDYGSADTIKTIEGGSVGVRSLGNASVRYKWQRDQNTPKSVSLSLSTNNAELAPSTGTEFLLGTHTLGEQGYITNHFDLEEGGEFRTIRYTLSNNEPNESADIDNFGATITGGGHATE